MSYLRVSYRDPRVRAFEGNVFSQSTTPAGLVIPAFTATSIGGGSLPLWNPPDSGVDVELLQVSCARVSGTATFGAIGVMARPLRRIGSGEVMTAMNVTTPVNGFVFAGFSSRCQSSNSGTNTVTAGSASDWIRTLFTFNLEADTGTAHETTKAVYDFDGTLVIPPGVLVYLAASQGTSALFASTIVWREVTR